MKFRETPGETNKKITNPKRKEVLMEELRWKVGVVMNLWQQVRKVFQINYKYDRFNQVRYIICPRSSMDRTAHS